MQKAVWRGALVASFVIGCVGVGESTAKEQTTEYDLTEPKMSCAEADKVTRRALERLYYKVTDAPKTPADTGGEIKGIRLGFWGEKEPVSVKIPN